MNKQKVWEFHDLNNRDRDFMGIFYGMWLTKNVILEFGDLTW